MQINVRHIALSAKEKNDTSDEKSDVASFSASKIYCKIIEIWAIVVCMITAHKQQQLLFQLLA